MSRRSYGQYCALARTLDIVGERWTLLVVRELIAGPKRYSDLLVALPGVGTSLLARRLQTLESQGIVVRRHLPPPAASIVYELTDTGVELAEALLPLVGWGARHLLGARKRGEAFRAEWPLLIVYEVLQTIDTADLAVVYEFRVDDSVAHLRIDHGRVSVQAGPAERPDVVMTADIETFVELGTGRIDASGALADGRLQLDGTAEAVERFVQLMGTVVDTTRSPT